MKAVVYFAFLVLISSASAAKTTKDEKSKRSLPGDITHGWNSLDLLGGGTLPYGGLNSYSYGSGLGGIGTISIADLGSSTIIGSGLGNTALHGSIIGSGFGGYGGSLGYSTGVIGVSKSQEIARHTIHTIANKIVVPVPQPYPVPVTKNIPVPQPYPVPVQRPVPVPVQVRVPVPVDRPVPFKVPQPVPVPVHVKVPVRVDKPYPVPVVKTVPVPIDRPVPVKVPHPVPVPVSQPYPVPVRRPVPVPVPEPVLIRVPEVIKVHKTITTGLLGFPSSIGDGGVRSYTTDDQRVPPNSLLAQFLLPPPETVTVPSGYAADSGAAPVSGFGSQIYSPQRLPPNSLIPGLVLERPEQVTISPFVSYPIQGRYGSGVSSSDWSSRNIYKRSNKSKV